MKKLFFLFHFTFLIFNSSFSQDSCNLKISLLTCSPGEELYSTFGHTAIRVKDFANGSDLVFNYGTFEFSPQFYSQFIRGKLLYILSVEEFASFIYQYQQQSRTVVEQLIQISCDQKQKLLNALLVNARPENRSYRYDFLFDNCTTRAGDMIVNHADTTPVFKNILPEEIPTFRNLIHSYLIKGGQDWSKLGIDILLGPKLDKEVTNRQAMFLPDYLLKGFDSTLVNGKELVNPVQPVLTMPSPLNNGSILRPGFISFLLLIVVLLLSFSKQAWTKRALDIFDFLFFYSWSYRSFTVIYVVWHRSLCLPIQF